MSPSPRVWLLLAASAFALTAVAGGLLLYIEPGATTLGTIALALMFSLLCLHLATRTPQALATAGCTQCGAVRDPSITFCTKCGT